MDTFNPTQNDGTNWNLKTGSRWIPLPNQKLEPITDDERNEYLDYVDDLIDKTRKDLMEGNE